jgi:hypothetical protein
MKGFKIIMVLVFSWLLCIGASQGTKPSSTSGTTALNLLRQRERSVTWDARSLLTADFDYDGVDDFAVGGKMGAKYVLGVVKGPLSGQSKHWTFTFAEDAGDQGSLCSVSNARIRLEPLDEEEVEGARNLPANSRGINLYDDKCDSFHIFWDRKEGRFTYERL